jgi:signal transduction histidine kinase
VNIIYVLIILSYFSAAMLPFALVILAWQNRHVKGAYSFIMTMIVATGWSASGLLTITSYNDASAAVWLRVSYIFIPFVGFTLYSVAIDLVHPPKIWHQLRPFLLILPVAYLVLVLTDGWQQWLVVNAEFVRDDSGLVLHIVRDISIAFSMQSVVNYIYIAISSGFFIWRWRRPRTTLERKQMTLVLSAIAIPLIADSVNIFVFDRIFVLTPVFFNIATPLVYLAVFRHNLMGLIPIAYERIFSNMKDPVLVVDDQLNVLELNQAARDLIGNDLPEQPIGIPLIQLFSGYQDIIQNWQDHYQLQGEVYDADHERYFNITVTPLYDRNGRIEGRLIVLRNVTQIYTNQERELAIKLEQERVHTIRNFMQAATHEFRTPLSIIQSSAYLMERTDNEAKRHLQKTKVDNQVKRIADLTDDLLLMTRLDADADIAIHTFDITAVMHVLSQYEPLKGVDVQLDLPEEHLEVKGDQMLIKRAVQEVLDNALLYHDKRFALSISLQAKPKIIEIVVRDAGGGIPDTHLPYVFDSFYRGDSARSTAGFGVGLAIAQKVVVLHNGKIELKNIQHTIIQDNTETHIKGLEVCICLPYTL